MKIFVYQLPFKKISKSSLYIRNLLANHWASWICRSALGQDCRSYLCFEFDASSDLLKIKWMWSLFGSFDSYGLYFVFDVFRVNSMVLVAHYSAAVASNISLALLNTSIWLTCEILLALLIPIESKYSFFALDGPLYYIFTSMNGAVNHWIIV